MVSLRLHSHVIPQMMCYEDGILDDSGPYFRISWSPHYSICSVWRSSLCLTLFSIGIAATAEKSLYIFHDALWMLLIFSFSTITVSTYYQNTMIQSEYRLWCEIKSLEYKTLFVYMMRRSARNPFSIVIDMLQVMVSCLEPAFSTIGLSSFEESPVSVTLRCCCTMAIKLVAMGT